MKVQSAARALKLVSNFYIDRQGTPWWGNTTDQSTLQIELEQRYADQLFDAAFLLGKNIRNGLLNLAWYVDAEGEIIPKFELVK